MKLAIFALAVGILSTSAVAAKSMHYKHATGAAVDQEDAGPMDEYQYLYMYGREPVKSVYGFPAVKESESVEASSVCVSPFPPDVPSSGKQWTRVGYLDMTDPTQQCPVSLKKFTSPRASCGKKTEGRACDSVIIGTSGASYQRICGRFRGYQVGSTDAFNNFPDSDGKALEGNYVDGISITYGLPGNRQHLFTYAAGIRENPSHPSVCPCIPGGVAPPSFVGSDYYCESGNPGPNWDGTTLLHADPLWDGQQCGGLEGTCCSPPNLAWFCKTLPAPTSGDLEVRICLDQNLNDENVALEFFELYIK